MLKNMKIGKKLIITFILVTIISSIGSVMGLYVMTNMNSKYGAALENYGFAQGDIGRFSTELNNVRVLLRNVIIDTDMAKMENDRNEITKSFDKLDTYLSQVGKKLDSDKEKKEYDNIKNNMGNFIEVANQEVELAMQNKNTEAYAILVNQATPLANTIRTSTESIMDEKTTTGDSLATKLSAQGNLASILILVVMSISLAVSLIIALIISRGISKPVTEMAYAAERMSEGDLSVEIDIHSKDEIGQLGTAFVKSNQMIRAYITDIKENLGKMALGDLNINIQQDYKGEFIELKNSIHSIVASLNDALTKINQAAEQVATGSDQVSDGSQELAQGATEQASAVEELSASILEISDHIKKNAGHATKASENVNLVSEEIEVSNLHMTEMVSAMTQINDSSSQIGKIIKTIEDIAFQTNILALNAAVEAARAGAAGKGFAVVADEVRNLATKSAEAAKDTTTLIENSMNQVENGTKIADETASSLLKVVERAKDVASIVENISDISNRQSSAINEVTLGVDQISSVVQTNAATAEESAAASEELSGQAQTLKVLVSRFQLRNNAV
ncbi:methyl-accepting chemotaxis protein [Aminipila terrae]|uniref:HAMP domain-containing protein n=1 Tax=Aminipila terrae TaxID=2697030 RepID=A0A6P1MQ32_9FIRM|nr:methyl-accepting chemotaxis protein [Aminipila terrae]QHI73105.1 HAMP domain-containing protein [Aminipila terrae]